MLSTDGTPSELFTKCLWRLSPAHSQANCHGEKRAFYYPFCKQLIIIIIFKIQDFLTDAVRRRRSGKLFLSCGLLDGVFKPVSVSLETENKNGNSHSLYKDMAGSYLFSR